MLHVERRSGRPLPGDPWKYCNTMPGLGFPGMAGYQIPLDAVDDTTLSEAELKKVAIRTILPKYFGEAAQDRYEAIISSSDMKAIPIKRIHRNEVLDKLLADLKAQLDSPKFTADIQAKLDRQMSRTILEDYDGVARWIVIQPEPAWLQNTSITQMGYPAHENVLNLRDHVVGCAGYLVTTKRMQHGRRVNKMLLTDIEAVLAGDAELKTAFAKIKASFTAKWERKVKDAIEEEYSIMGNSVFRPLWWLVIRR